MTSHDPARLDHLFHSAAQLLPSERAAFLASECGADTELRDLIESLLQADEDPKSFASPWQGTSVQSLLDADPLGPGTRLGPYRLIREIGRGGMGIVFLAERADGEYEQQVAIKVISAGVSGPDLAARFLRERQILARLNHPAIARLLDGGLTPDRRPYLVMEYIDGQPLAEYCDARQLSLRERLGLFCQICGAVASAHQSLVIHRDLKPSNILVTPAGQPKLLDFGIAKILTQDSEPADLQTIQILTPHYASPEQVRGEPAGTATDVYSLGALLFELLTGRRPFASATSPLDVMTAVQEQAPPRPSDAASNTALRGDLDKIVLQALQKDPAQRYSSAEAFAADVQRYLDGFPVAAQGASLRYRAGKFVRRHRWGVLAAAAALLLAAVGFASVVRSRNIAEAQRVRAERRFTELRQLAKSYVVEVDPQLEGIPGTTKVRLFMFKRALTYLDSLSAETSGDTLLQREVASSYTKLANVQGVPAYANLGDLPGALTSIEKAMRLRREVVAATPNSDEDHFLLAYSSSVLGELKAAAGDPGAAAPAYQESVRELEALLARTPKPRGRLLYFAGTCMQLLGHAYGGNGPVPHLGDPVAALPLLERGLALLVREGEVREKEEPNPQVLNRYRYSNQAAGEVMIGRLHLNGLNQPDEAAKHFQRAIALLHTPGVDLTNAEIRRKLLIAQASYATVLVSRRQIAEALPLIEAAQKTSRSLLETDPENQAAQTDATILAMLAGQADAMAHPNGQGWQQIQQTLAQEQARVAKDPLSAVRHSGLASLYLQAADSARQGNRLDLARQQYTAAANLARQSSAAHASDNKAKLDLSAAEHGIAECLRHAGDSANAAEHDRLASKAARQVLDQHPNNPQAQALFAAASGLPVQ